MSTLENLIEEIITSDADGKQLKTLPKRSKNV